MVEVIDCEQGTEEWLHARLGIPTASEFHTVMGRQWDAAADPKTRRWYLLRLIGERLTGKPSDFWRNEDMERGKRQEPMARALYEFLTDNQVQQVGFLRNVTRKKNIVGASPDGLIGSSGMLEIKSKLPHLLLDIILNNKVPSEHYGQCQGNLWVAEREWIDFMAYWPGMDPFICRVERDESYMRHLDLEVDMFWEDLMRVESIVKSGKITGPVQTSTPRRNPIEVKF